MSDIKAIDVTDPDELASELDQLSHTYAVRTGDYSMAGSLSAAADWLRFQSERIAELEAKLRESQWVAVSERLPEERLSVIAFTPQGERIAYYDPSGDAKRRSEWWDSHEDYALYVTHWMPIPPLPEGDDGGDK